MKNLWTLCFYSRQVTSKCLFSYFDAWISKTENLWMGDPGTKPILLKPQSFTGAGFAGDTFPEPFWVWGAGFTGDTFLEPFWVWVAGFARLFFWFGVLFLIFAWGAAFAWC